MAAVHRTGLGPSRSMSLAQLGQWAADHEKSDDRQFASIERKMSWAIGLLVAVLLSVIGSLGLELVRQQDARMYALEHPAAAAAAELAR